jgi:hypothetical protein
MAVYDYIHDQEEQESYEKMSDLFVEEEVFILFEFREKISSLRSIVFRVWCSEFGVQSLVFRVWCSEFGVQSLVFRVWCSEFGVQSLVFEVDGCARMRTLGRSCEASKDFAMASKTVVHVMKLFHLPSDGRKRL